jgi:SWI/SNF-related matrix-associated actin-dependent regulator of chromatin subfamily A3
MKVLLTYRIVFDEMIVNSSLAHRIRNQSTKSFRAITSLTACIRWCLTGTPIQNELEDLGALIRFLQVPSLSKPQEFRKYCIQPVEKKGRDGFRNIRTLLQCLCIRRTKDLLELPPFEAKTYRLQLSSTERSNYSRITDAYKSAIDDAVCGRKPADAHSSILRALLKLRMICNHGKELATNSDPSDGSEHLLEFLQDGLKLCVYCDAEIAPDRSKDELPGARLLACSHLVCRGCLNAYKEDLERIREGFDISCLKCSALMIDDPLDGANMSQDEMVLTPNPQTYASTKFERILKDIKEHLSTDKW